MVTRREVFRIAGACCACLGGASAFAQVPRSFVAPRSHGIISCGNEPTSDQKFVPNANFVRSTSGVPELDDNIALERRTLDYWFGFINAAGTREWNKPSFAFYDDRRQRIGARAIRGSRDHAEIYLGLSLIGDEVRADPNRWQVVVIGTLAHEWAHAYQYNSNFDARLFRWETHADFLAGWYLGLKQASGLPVDMTAFSRALFERGSRLGRFSEDAYGLPDQRVEAMEKGREFGFNQLRRERMANVDAAATAGYQVVTQIADRGR